MGARRRLGALAVSACLAVVLLAPLAASQALEKHHHKSPHGHAHGHGDEEQLECGDVRHLGPADDVCAFVSEHCSEHGSLLNYPWLYYCVVEPHGLLLGAIMVALCCATLALLFRIIARASDDFFSCILSQISQDLGLPPRLGGVTLLALGNGAPDLSASIEAVKSGDYQLAMGALTGAGMFVGAVVAGRIVTLNGGVRARGAQLRDISTQFITVAVVAGIVASGAFTYASVAALLSIYGAYVVVVAVADFSKRMGVEWGEVARNVSRRMSSRWRMEMVTPLMREDYGAAEDYPGTAGGGTPLLPTPAAATPAGVHSRSRSASPGPFGKHAAAGSGPHLGGSGGNGGKLLSTPEDAQLPAGEAAELAPGGEQAAAGAAGGGQAGTPPGATFTRPGRPPLPLPTAGSLPHDIESALGGAAAADGGSGTGNFGAGPAGGRFSSLPDLQAEARRHAQAQQQQQERPVLHQSSDPLHHASEAHERHGHAHSQAHPWQQRHLRHSPPVAHFQPHMTYGDIVQMSAKEYRRRALAEMAQSKSFFSRGDGRVEEEERSESDSDGEAAGWQSGEEEGQGGEAEAWEQAAAERQQRQAERWRGRGRRSGGSGEYQPPVVGFDSTLLAAQEAVAEFEAEQAAAAEAGASQPPGAAGRGMPPRVLSGSSSSGRGTAAGAAAGAAAGGRLPSSGSHGSGASTAHYSVASLEVAPPPGTALGFPAAPGAGGGFGEAEGEERALRGPLGPLWQALEAVQWPLMSLLQATIPLVEANSYQRTWFLRSLAASPVFIAAYLHLFNWQAVLVSLAVGALLAAAGHLGTLGLEGKAPLWTLGTGYPIGAALVAVYGFAVAAMWISLFASEIVGLLQFFGMLFKAEPAVLGVTVLAWGNSLMDYFNNTAMAGKSRGGNSMAMTACFAGPLFNMLVGLGLGFWALFEETGAGRAAVTMDPIVLVGCLFIMLNCACLVGVSLSHRQWLPAWCGWAMVGCYAAYLAAVLAVMVVAG